MESACVEPCVEPALTCNYMMSGADAQEWLEMKVADDEMDETFMFHFACTGDYPDGYLFDIQWTCLDNSKTGTIENINIRSRFSMMMCMWAEHMEEEQ